MAEGTPNRRTRQRDAIAALFTEGGRPLSPQEVREAASDTVDEGVSLATVYRTLSAMVERGELASVDLPGQPSRYELAGKPHHHHFHCDACGRVFEVAGCPGSIDASAPAGFEVTRHEVTLFGRCASCAGGGAVRDGGFVGDEP